MAGRGSCARTWATHELTWEQAAPAASPASSFCRACPNSPIVASYRIILKSPASRNAVDASNYISTCAHYAQKDFWNRFSTTLRGRLKMKLDRNAEGKLKGGGRGARIRDSSAGVGDLETDERVEAEQCLVYVATIDLDVPEGPAQLLARFGSQTLPFAFEHCMVIVAEPDGKCFLFDFRPHNPTDPGVALRVLSGQAVPGLVQERRLTKLPRQRCWLVGAVAGNALQAARFFSGGWDSQLRIFRHDCREYTDALVEHLTGRKEIIREVFLQRMKLRLTAGRRAL